MKSTKRLKVAIVSNEFFDSSLGRMGGFGWIARQAASFFNSHPEYGIDAIFLTGELHAEERYEVISNGTRLLLRRKNTLDYWRALRAENIDAFFTVDYRPNYDHLFWMLPRTPIINWVNDPRPPEDIAKVNSLRVPGEDAQPQGITPVDCSPWAKIVRMSKWTGRPIVYASPAPSTLLPKASRTYAVDVLDVKFLGYVLNAERLVGEARKHEQPRVIFLGRLDPIKRPWVFAELGRSFPQVEFLFLGQSHFSGPGSWQLRDLAPNVKLAGHLEGDQKRDLVSSAWALINTSIHEALPVSFVEALLYETPIVSCQNPESLSSTFGRYVGRWDADGLDGLTEFGNGLTWLLSDDARRQRLGQAGRKWAETHHSDQRFLHQFWKCCEKAGITIPADAREAREAAQADFSQQG
jgi:glycosyltransferase involved in cell wall biosynthesis